MTNAASPCAARITTNARTAERFISSLCSAAQRCTRNDSSYRAALSANRLTSLDTTSAPRTQGQQVAIPITRYATSAKRSLTTNNVMSAKNNYWYPLFEVLRVLPRTNGSKIESAISMKTPSAYFMRQYDILNKIAYRVCRRYRVHVIHSEALCKKIRSRHPHLQTRSFELPSSWLHIGYLTPNQHTETVTAVREPEIARRREEKITKLSKNKQPQTDQQREALALVFELEKLLPTIERRTKNATSLSTREIRSNAAKQTWLRRQQGISAGFNGVDDFTSGSDHGACNQQQY